MTGGAEQRGESASHSASADGTRRFSDREFGLIIRRAFELEERSPEPVEGKSGLTLDEMREIAVEVGLSPDAITRAAALLPNERTGRAAKLLGAPEAWAYELWLETGLADGVEDVLLQTIRRVLGQKGEVRRMGDVVEWKSVGRSDHVYVTLASHGRRTVIDVSGDRRGTVLFTILFPFLIWGAAASVGGYLLPSLVGTLLMPVVAVIGGLLTARMVWQSRSRDLRARLERLAVSLRLDSMRFAGLPDTTGES